MNQFQSHPTRITKRFLNRKIIQFTLDQGKKQTVQNKLFKTKCQRYLDHQVMANRAVGRTTGPYIAWDDKGTCEELETESTETDSAFKNQSGSARVHYSEE